MRCSATVLTLLALLLPSALPAQRPAIDLEGRLIRVHDPEVVLTSGGILHSSIPRVGTLLAAMGDTIVIRRNDGQGTERVVLGESSQMQLRGKTRAGVRGAILGLLAGSAIGAAVGLTTFEQEYGPVCRDLGEAIGAALFGGSCPRGEINSLGEYTSLRAVVGGSAGALLGWMIGNQIQVDSWLPMSRGWLRAGVGVAPTETGWGPEVRLRF